MRDTKKGKKEENKPKYNLTVPMSSRRLCSHKLKPLTVENHESQMLLKHQTVRLLVIRQIKEL